MASLDEKAQKLENEKFSKAHHSQVFDHPPLLPCHYFVFDPMHALHCEFNVLIDESIHQHLVVQIDSPEVMSEIRAATRDVNQMWQNAHLPKFMQFGKDDQGSHSHAANGPAFKAIVRSNLLQRTFERMMPVWVLVEKHATPTMGKDRIGMQKKRQMAQKKTKAKRNRSNRIAEFNDGAEELENDDVAPETDGMGEQFEIDIPTQSTYAQRVGLAFHAFTEFYSYLHEGHNIAAKDMSPEERDKRACHAVDLAKRSQKATLALIGTHRRRTYAHDLVYGIHQLYKLFGKPWNASTEGNEHAHQDMKNFFRHMVAHAGKNSKSDCIQVLKLMHVKTQLLHTHGDRFFSASKYNAMRSNMILTGKNGKKVGGKELPSHYESDDKMLPHMAVLKEWAEAGTAKPCEDAVPMDCTN